VSNIDYKKLKKDLMNIAGPSGVMPLIVSIDSASNKELLRYAREYGIDISEYEKDHETEYEEYEEYEEDDETEYEEEVEEYEEEHDYPEEQDYSKLLADAFSELDNTINDLAKDILAHGTEKDQNLDLKFEKEDSNPDEIQDFIPLNDLSEDDFEAGGRIARGINFYLKENVNNYLDYVKDKTKLNEAFQNLFLDIVNLVDFEIYRETIVEDSYVNGFCLKAIFMHSIKDFWSEITNEFKNYDKILQQYTNILNNIMRYLFSRKDQFTDNELISSLGTFGIKRRELLCKILNNYKLKKDSNVLKNKLEFIDLLIKESMKHNDMTMPLINGKINGIMLLYYLSEDAIYFKEDQISYNNAEHKIEKFELNEERIWLNADLLLDLDNFFLEMINLGDYLEENLSLRIPISNIGDEAKEVFRNEDVTAITLLNLFTSGYARFVIVDTDIYCIHLDDFLKESFSMYEEYMTEFISSIRSYMGMDMKQVKLIFNDEFDMPYELKKKFGIDRSIPVNTRFINAEIENVRDKHFSNPSPHAAKSLDSYISKYKKIEPDIKLAAKSGVRDFIADYFIGKGNEVYEGEKFGFIKYSLVVRLKSVDVQIKLITGKAGVDFYAEDEDQEKNKAFEFFDKVITDNKKKCRYTITKELIGYFLKNGVEVFDGVSFGFTEGTLVVRLKSNDVQVKFITPKEGVDFYEFLEEEVDEINLTENEAEKTKQIKLDEQRKSLLKREEELQKREEKLYNNKSGGFIKVIEAVGWIWIALWLIFGLILVSAIGGVDGSFILLLFFMSPGIAIVFWRYKARKNFKTENQKIINEKKELANSKNILDSGVLLNET